MRKYTALLIATLLLASLCACVSGTESAQPADAAATFAQPEAPAPTAVPVADDTADYAALQSVLLQISTDYFPGTAGCSLTAARLAGMLLDWNAKNAGSNDGIGRTVASTIESLPSEAAAEYVDKFDDIFETAVMLTEDYALNYLESAGYTPEAYPYDNASVSALFSALQAGIPAEMLGYLRRVEPSTPIAIDMDGDGAMETVTVSVDEDAYVMDVAVSGANGSYTDHVDTGLTYLSAYIGDAWLNTGAQALFLCGDEASDDYDTLVYRVQDGELQRCEIYGRLLDANEKGQLTLERAIDVFGTYGGVCQYQLQDEGFAFKLATPFRVQNYGDHWEARKLTVICDGLPAVLMDGSDKEVTLSKGTELALLETDQESYAMLGNANGDMYRVAIERHDDDWQWYLNGVPENECFTPLLYAG